MLIISCNCLGVWKKAHKKKDSGRNDRSLSLAAILRIKSTKSVMDAVKVVCYIEYIGMLQTAVPV